MPTSCRHTDTQQLINSSMLRTVTEKGRFPSSSSCRDDIVNTRRLSGASYLSSVLGCTKQASSMARCA